MIVAWNEFLGKRFTEKDAEEFFGLSKDQIKEHIDNGTCIPVGIRYWYVDELLEPNMEDKNVADTTGSN